METHIKIKTKGDTRISIEIRSVTDFRYKFNEIKEAAKNKPIYLTRNGHGILVVMSIDYFSKMTDDIDALLNEADRETRENSVRYAGEDVFKRLRERYE